MASKKKSSSQSPGGGEAARRRAAQARTSKGASTQKKANKAQAQKMVNRAVQRTKTERSGLNKALDTAALVGVGLAAGKLASPAVGRVAGKATSRAVSRSRIANAAGDDTFNYMTKNYSKARPGGKVSRTQTPMGPTIRSTRLQTPEQLSSRLINLSKYADTVAQQPVKSLARNLGKAANKAARRTTTAGGAAAGAVASRRKKK